MNSTITKPVNIFQKLLRFIGNHALLVLIFSFILLAISAWSLRHSKLQLDIYDVYDPAFLSSIDLSDMKAFYNDHSQMLVAFHFNEEPTSGEICKLLRWRRELSHYKEIKTITSIWSIRSPLVKYERVLYPKELADPCDADPESIYQLDPGYSRKYFRHLISRAGTKDIVFDISFSGQDSDTSQVQYIIDETEKFVSSHFKEVKAEFLGMASFRYYFKKIMFQDSVYNILILVIILCFMRMVYGTWISGFYLGLTIVGANILLYGAMALLGFPIDILTNNLFLMSAVAGTADFIFVTQYQMTGSYRESFTELITPCFFTTLTTVIGFLSLNTSDLEIIQRFGNGAALATLAEWLMMFIFLPAMLKVFNKEKIWVNPAKVLKTSFIDKLEALSMPKGLLHFFTFLMILSIPSFFFLNDQDSPVKNLPSNHVLRKAYENFHSRFSWQGQVYLYFPEKPNPTFQEKVLNAVKKDELVFRVENPEELAQEWTTGLTPLRKDLIRRELSMTALWERYFSDAGTLRVPLYLKEQDLLSLKKLRNRVNQLCRGQCRLAGQRVVYLEYGEKISRTMIESFAVSIILVVGILACLLWVKGKIIYFIPVTISALMGPLVILTFIALFQIPVTLITSIFLAVMVGLAGDNAIQYLLANEENLEAGINSRSRASIVVTLVMLFGSAMFTLQSLLPMKILGILFISGFTINLMGDLWGLKGLLIKKVD